jgi:tetratricopeptide (TPR) repeat protein
MLTDMVGFAALTQRDEPLALQLLEEHRGIVRSSIGAHRGREVKTLGDGFLVEFESALDATACAVDIQRRFEERNRTSGQERIQLRIGLHVGDVVHELGDVYGDAVNIASRLEPLAEPGGILVSGAVYDQVRGKAGVEFSSIPPPSLKHIALAVTAYRVELPWLALGGGGPGSLTPWTDREREADVLRRAIERAMHGEGRLLVVQGEPGIGKSRLAEEILGEAERRGLRVLRTRAYRGEEDAPYGPWTRILRGLARDSTTDLLRTACGPFADEVAKLAPEVTARLGSIAPGPTLDPEAANRRFLEGISQVFLNLSATGSLALFLDDLQWVDPASAHLLGVLVRQLASHPVLVVASYRTTDPTETPGLAELLVELRRIHRLETIELRRLGPEEFDRLVAAVLRPARVAAEVRRLLFERSGGNPFFAEELVQKLVGDGALTHEPGGWSLRPGVPLRLPETLRAVLRERLQGLDPPTLQLLRIAAVAGPSFSAELLEKVSELDEEAFLTASERAYQRRILEERRLGPGRSELAFTDPQIAQGLYEELTPVFRHRIHRKIAQTLETIDPEGAPRRAAELARHYLEANEPAKALEYVRLAAKNAEAVFARNEAKRHDETALELLADRPDDPARAEILEALGGQCEALGQPREAIRAWKEAVRIHRRSGGIRSAANLERRQGYAHRQYLQDSAAALSALESARQTLEPLGETPELAAVYGDLADLYWYDRKSDAAREACERARALAAKTGAYDVEAWADLILASLAPPERRSEMFSLLETMLRVGRERQLAEVVIGAYHNLAAATFYSRGDQADALRLVDEGVAEARSVGSKAGEMLLRARLAPLFLTSAGELARAEEAAQSMLDYVGLFSPRPEPLSLLVLAEVAQVRGDLARAEELGRRALEVLRHSPDWSIRNLVDGILGAIRLERADATGAAAAVSESYLATRAMGVSAWGATGYLRLATVLGEALLRGAPATAVQLAPEEIAAEADRIAGAVGDGPAVACAAELRALLEEKAGRWDAAAERWRRARDVWRALRFPWDEARVSARLAATLERAGQVAPAEEARSEGESLLRRLGSRRTSAVPLRGETAPLPPTATHSPR